MISIYRLCLLLTDLILKHPLSQSLRLSLITVGQSTSDKGLSLSVTPREGEKKAVTYEVVDLGSGGSLQASYFLVITLQYNGPREKKWTLVRREFGEPLLTSKKQDGISVEVDTSLEVLSDSIEVILVSLLDSVNRKVTDELALIKHLSPESIVYEMDEKFNRQQIKLLIRVDAWLSREWNPYITCVKEINLNVSPPD